MLLFSLLKFAVLFFEEGAFAVLGKILTVLSPWVIFQELIFPSLLVLLVNIGTINTISLTSPTAQCLSWLFIDIFVFIIEVFVFKDDMLVQRIFGMIIIAFGCLLYLYTSNMHSNCPKERKYSEIPLAEVNCIE